MSRRNRNGNYRHDLRELGANFGRDWREEQAEVMTADEEAALVAELKGLSNQELTDKLLASKQAIIDHNKKYIEFLKGRVREYRRSLREAAFSFLCLGVIIGGIAGYILRIISE